MQQQPGSKKRKILIIDDEAPVRSTLQKYIQLLGHEVILTGSGEEGLKSLQETTPDLILLDINMPGMDGLATLGQLHEKYETVQVVMLAGPNDVPKAHQALNFGAGDFIAKPIELPVLKNLFQLHFPGTR
jgi:DNA-binding NtrC family response regulator